MSRPGLRPGAWLALVLVLALAPPASAYVFVTTPNGVPIAWRQRCVEAWLHTVVPPTTTADATYTALDGAVAAWNDVSCTWLRGAERGFTCFDAIGLSPWPGPQDVILWRATPESWQHAYRVVALTSVTYDKRSGEIVDADIELNGEDYLFAIDGDRTAYDLVQTLTHELGHVYGLDHSADRDATMYALSYEGETTKRTLEPDDIDGICTSHPLASAPSGGQCRAQPAAPVDDPWCPAAPEFGCAATQGAPDLALGLVLAGAPLLALRDRRRRLRARAHR